MPAALSLQQRQEIIQSRDSGESFASIARRVQRSYGAVRNIYHRFIQTGDLIPAYDKCCHQSIRKDEAIYHRAVEMKGKHPGWGAGLIWVELAEEFAEESLPSPRTLQRWFKRAGVQAPAPDRRPLPFAQRGKYAHDVWAIDAKEVMELADGTYASWFTVTDEGSGAILEASLFPHQTLVIGQSPSSQSHTSSSDGVLGMSEEDTHG